VCGHSDALTEILVLFTYQTTSSILWKKGGVENSAYLFGGHCLITDKVLN
jgi:hypothetical protein